MVRRMSLLRPMERVGLARQALQHRRQARHRQRQVLQCVHQRPQCGGLQRQRPEWEWSGQPLLRQQLPARLGQSC